MIYSQLSKSYKLEYIAIAVHARETEYFHYEFDLINFRYLLGVLTDGAAKVDIEKRIGETMQQMEMVEKVHAALLAQIDDPDAYQAAVLKVTVKREEQENEVRPRT